MRKHVLSVVVLNINVGKTYSKSLIAKQTLNKLVSFQNKQRVRCGVKVACL